LRSIENIKFTNALNYAAQVLIDAKVATSAIGAVKVGEALTITGSSGANSVSYSVTGGMGKSLIRN